MLLKLKTHGMHHGSFISSSPSERTRAPSSFVGVGHSFATSAGFSSICVTEVDGILDSQSNPSPGTTASSSLVSEGLDSHDSQDDVDRSTACLGIARLVTNDSYSDIDSDDDSDHDIDSEGLEDPHSLGSNLEDTKQVGSYMRARLDTMSTVNSRDVPISFVSGTFTNGTFTSSNPVNSRGIPISFGSLPPRRRKRDVVKACFRRTFACFDVLPELDSRGEIIPR